MNNTTSNEMVEPYLAKWAQFVNILRMLEPKFKENEIVEFLREIDAPQTLKGIVGVAERILLMQESGLLRGAAGTEERLTTWSLIARTVVEQQAVFERAMPDVMPSANAKYLYGVISESPVYAALWHSARLADEMEDLDKPFLILQSFLLLWYITIGHDATSQHRKPFGLAIRTLSEKSEIARTVLSELPTEIDSDGQYLAMVSRVKGKLRASASAYELLGKIEQLIRSLMGLEGLIARPHEGNSAAMGGAHVRGDRRRRGNSQEMPTGDDDSDVLVTRKKYNKTSDEKNGRSNGGDTNPDGIMAQCHGKHPFDSGCYSRGAYEVRVRHRQAAIDRSHNTCHAEFNQADPNSIRLLIDALSRCDTSHSEWQAELSLGVTLACGRDVKTIARLSIDCASDVIPVEPQSSCIYLKPKRFVFDAPTAIAFRARHDLIAPSREAVNFVVLALPDYLERISILRLEMLTRNTQAQVVKAFQLKTATLERGMKRLVKPIESPAGESLGLGKLRRFVFNRLRNHDRGGHVAASLICDRVSPMSKNPLAYRWTPLNALLSVHTEFVGEYAQRKI